MGNDTYSLCVAKGRGGRGTSYTRTTIEYYIAYKVVKKVAAIFYYWPTHMICTYIINKMHDFPNQFGRQIYVLLLLYVVNVAESRRSKPRLLRINVLFFQI